MFLEGGNYYWSSARRVEREKKKREMRFEEENGHGCRLQTLWS